MLTCKIGWRTLVPVRAIPFLTGGTFDARAVATLFFHPDKFAGDGFAPRTWPIRVGMDGSLVGVAPAEFGIAYHLLCREEQGPLLKLKHIRQLPPGVLVWRRPLKILYDFLAKQDVSQDAANLGDHPAGSLGWIETTSLGAKQYAVVWEGCTNLDSENLAKKGTYGSATAATHSANAEDETLVRYAPHPNPSAIWDARLSASHGTQARKWDQDPKLQSIAENIVKEMKSSERKVPSLMKLVRRIREHPDFDPQLANVSDNTIARRIRASWKERERRRS